MKQEIIYCDNCGVKKGEANHWFSAWLDTRPVQQGKPCETMTIETWNMHRRPFIDLCGQACVSACVARWMATGKLLEEKA